MQTQDTDTVSHLYSVDTHTHTDCLAYVSCVCVCMCGTDESELRCTYSFNSLDNGHSSRPSHIPVAVTSHNQHRSHSYIRLFAPRGNKQHSIDSRGPCCATLYPYLPPSLPSSPLRSLSLALPYRVTLLYICHAHNEVEQKCFTAKKPLGLLYTSLASSRFPLPFPLPTSLHSSSSSRVQAAVASSGQEAKRNNENSFGFNTFSSFFQLLLLLCFCFSFIDSLCVCVCVQEERHDNE